MVWVSYGKLKMPMPDGSASTEMDVLVVERAVSVVDSLFLAGAPAPPALLSAFGLTQGGTIETLAYFIYRPNYSGYLARLNVNQSTGQVTSLFIDPRGAQKTVPTSVSEVTNSKFNAYPNPAIKGNSFILESEKINGKITFNVIDVLGSVVYSNTTMAFQKLSWNIPATINSGVYFYQATNEAGKLIATGKINIE